MSAGIETFVAATHDDRFRCGQVRFCARPSAFRSTFGVFSALHFRRTPGKNAPCATPTTSVYTHRRRSGEWGRLSPPKNCKAPLKLRGELEGGSFVLRATDFQSSVKSNQIFAHAFTPTTTRQGVPPKFSRTLRRRRHHGAHIHYLFTIVALADPLRYHVHREQKPADRSLIIHRVESPM